MTAIRQAQQEASGPIDRDYWFARAIRRFQPTAVRYLGDQEVWWMPPDQVVAHTACGTFPRANPWIYGGGNASQIAVFGPAWKERLVNDGVPPDKIRVTGHPEQDKWFAQKNSWQNSDTRQVIAELGLPNDKGIVSVIAPAFCFRAAGGNRDGDISIDELQRDFVRIVDALSKRDEQVSVVVKAHPRDTVEDLAFISARSANQSVRLVRDIEIHRLLLASQAMACQWSTTAVTAAAVRTPVIVFDFHQSPSGDMWRGAPGINCASSIEEFETAIESILTDPMCRQECLRGCDQFARDYLTPDGQAARRLTRLMLRMSGNPVHGDLAKAA